MGVMCQERGAGLLPCLSLCYYRHVGLTPIPTRRNRESSKRNTPMTSKASVSQMMEIAHKLDLNVTAAAAQSVRISCTVLANAVISESGCGALNPSSQVDAYEKDQIVLNEWLKADVSHMLEASLVTTSEIVARAAQAVEGAALVLATVIARELGVAALDFDVQPVAYGGALATFGPA